MERIGIGIDLGGTQLRAALVDERGNLFARRAEKTDAQGGPIRILSQIRRLVDELTATSGLLNIVGIGVSAPGPIDTLAGVAMDIPTLAGFEDFPLKTELQKLFPFPVSLENDGIAAATGEWRFGAGKGLNNMVYVTVSTGIGGGVIADGRVLHGRKGMAAHVGHMSIVPDGDICSCGNKGCFEAYGSGTAFTRRARLQAAQCRDTILGKNKLDIESHDVFAAAESGDRLANSLIEEEAEILGRGFMSLIHIFSPELVVMGGGLSNQFERLRPGIEAHIARCSMPAFRDIPVRQAALGQNSGLIGAAAISLLAVDADPLRSATRRP